MQSNLRHIFTILLLSCGFALNAQKQKLFSPDQRAAALGLQTVVMDFLERYFDELPQVKNTTVANKMAEDKVCFRNGKMSDLSLIADTMPLSISLINRFYEVEWKLQEKPFVTIVFPAQYDLLLGISQVEAQRNLKEDILSAPNHVDSLIVRSNLTMMEDSVYMYKTDYIEFENFNDAVYFNKECGSYQPIFEVTRLDYSAANLFHGLIENTDYRMYVEQSVYGMTTVNYTISLSQWLDYCAAWRLKVFFDVEEKREDGLLALIIARSEELGFNHMLSVVIPDKFVTDKQAILKVRMTPYIPTHNVKNLFQKENVKRRKINWQ